MVFSTYSTCFNVFSLTLKGIACLLDHPHMWQNHGDSHRAVKLIGYDPWVDASVAESVGVKKVDFDTLFKEADFLSFHLPLNEKTKNLIGERELRMMKSTSYLINTSRAGVMEEKALLRCLQENWIAGAAIDVYHQEPIDSNYPLLNLPNVVCTPHIGGASHDVVNHMAEIGIMGLIDFLNGKDSNVIINPESIERARKKMALKI